MSSRTRDHRCTRSQTKVVGGAGVSLYSRVVRSTPTIGRRLIPRDDCNIQRVNKGHKFTWLVQLLTQASVTQMELRAVVSSQSFLRTEMKARQMFLDSSILNVTKLSTLPVVGDPIAMSPPPSNSSHGRAATAACVCVRVC